MLANHVSARNTPKRYLDCFTFQANSMRTRLRSMTHLDRNGPRKDMMGTRQQKRIALVGCILFMTVPLTALGQEDRGNPQNGKVLFENHCANCHGTKGTGDGPDTQFLMVQPANFLSLESRSKTDWDLMNIITFGAVFSPMHGWANRLTVDERWDVLRYIRLLAPFHPLARFHLSPGRHG
jgi:mono/diheme cytochrome c family protein